MPTITFYTHVAELEHFACRLSKRAVAAGCRILLWSDSARQIEMLDQLLWSFEPESFLPHEIWLPGTICPPEPSILLANGKNLPSADSSLIVLNLSADLWSSVSPVPDRVLEIVGAGEQQLAEARHRFSAYRQNGFKIEHHNMQGKA